MRHDAYKEIVIEKYIYIKLVSDLVADPSFPESLAADIKAI